MTRATWFQFHVIKPDGTVAAESAIIEAVDDDAAMRELGVRFLVAPHKPIRAQEVTVPARAVLGHD